MGSIENLVRQFEKNPQNVRFADLRRVCEHYFGEARSKGSHSIYRTPWEGDPRINIQDDKGKAKAYQVRQVLKAIKKLEGS
ncbi:MAG: toxin HicA [Chloroflexi bacterium]|nr:toxin HicA [Chloroflexota bacterium]